jgi:SAM-dependent methyltransferase
MSPSTPSKDFFESVYQRSAAPWDVGAAQPALSALLDAFPPLGPVLDVGCGTGELVLELAARGLEVVGIDLVGAAIEKARAKVAAAPELAARIELRVGDALSPSKVAGSFRAVVDSGFFHLFGPDERRAFVADLTATLAPGGRFYLLGFAVTPPIPDAPREVREDELQALFASGWRALVLRSAFFSIKTGRGTVPALAACFERVPS